MFKHEYPDELVFIRIGRRYWTCGQDAVIARTIIQRDVFPARQAEHYADRLLRAGYCVTLADPR